LAQAAQQRQRVLIPFILLLHLLVVGVAVLLEIPTMAVMVAQAVVADGADLKPQVQHLHQDKVTTAELVMQQELVVAAAEQVQSVKLEAVLAVMVEMVLHHL
jgi:hypothetical protein